MILPISVELNSSENTAKWARVILSYMPTPSLSMIVVGLIAVVSSHDECVTDWALPFQ